MNRQASSTSRLVPFQQIKRNWLKHEDRLIHIKPTLNTRNNTSRHPAYRKCNYTKSLEIQFENKALLKKLTDRYDHLNDYSICINSSLPKSNHYQRRCENEGLYRRLKQAKPIIDTERLLNERRSTQKYINTISKFGFKGFKPTKTVLKFDMKNNDLKYLSKRKILIDSRLKQESMEQKHHLNPDRIINEECQKLKNNERLLQIFHKPTKITIDKTQVFLQITDCHKSIFFQITVHSKSDKQNDETIELQVKIQKSMFQSKFKNDLESLLKRLKYKKQTRMFYIV